MYVVRIGFSSQFAGPSSLKAESSMTTEAAKYFLLSLFASRGFPVKYRQLVSVKMCLNSNIHLVCRFAVVGTRV